MLPLLWLLAVGGLYYGVWRWITAAYLQIKYRLWALCLLQVGTTAFFLFMLPRAFQPPYRLLLIAAILLTFGWLGRWVATWHLERLGIRIWRQSFRRAAREFGLHLILITGAVLFSIPFAWLVITSFKEDLDMAKFPPVWIPRRQVETHLNGQPAGLATVNHNGQVLKVAVVEHLESGEEKVQVLEPATLRGKEMVLPRSEVKPIRHFGLKWENYRDALKFLPAETRYGWVFLQNTLILAILNLVGVVLSSSLVAYAFARLRFPGRDVLFYVMLATMMLPGAVTMLPVFLIFRWLGWVDTLRPLWVPAFFGSAFFIFLLRQFMLTIPVELEEAAKLDGCSPLGLYGRVVLPLIKPALAAVTIMTFLGSWNNFIGPLVYVNSPTKMPVAYALQLFQTEHSGEPGMLMAACTLVMVPVIALFFFTQRYFIQGVTLTGLKG